MRIIYTNHLKRRIKERGFPQNYPRIIYNRSKNRYYDKITQRNIAVSELNYAGKNRKLMISYDKMDDSVEIVTIHPIKNKEISNRVKSGRWMKNEK